MQRSRLPLMLALLTFGLALLAGLAAYDRLLRTVPVLVAVQDVPQGAPLGPDLVRVARVPAGGKPPLALYGAGQVVGRYAAVPLFADQILSQRHVTDQPGGRELTAALTPGQRVVSVPVRSEAVLGGALRPGDLVDVAAAWPGPEGKPGPVEVLATSVKVIDLRNAAGQSVTKAGMGGASLEAAAASALDNAVPTSALLLVSSQQARSLVGAVESKGAIYLWLAGRDKS